MREKTPSTDETQKTADTLRRGADALRPDPEFTRRLRAELRQQAAGRETGRRRAWGWPSLAWSGAAALLLGLAALALLLAPNLLGPRPAVPAPGQPQPFGEETAQVTDTSPDPAPTATMLPTAAGSRTVYTSPDAQWTAAVDALEEGGEQVFRITARGPAGETLSHEIRHELAQGGSPGVRAGLSELKWWPLAPTALYWYENYSTVDQCHYSWSARLTRMDLRTGAVSLVMPQGEAWRGALAFSPDTGEAAYIDRTQVWESTMPKTPAVVLRDLETGAEQRVAFRPIDERSWSARALIPQPGDHPVVLVMQTPAAEMCRQSQPREEVVAVDFTTGEALQQPIPEGYQFIGFSIDDDGYAELQDPAGGRARLAMRDGSLAAVEISPQEAAGAALWDFLAALAQGEYQRAVARYGGSTADLRSAIAVSGNAALSETSDAGELFRAACQSGMVCLPVLSSTFAAERDGFHFSVAYMQPDGSAFAIGRASRFNFHVKQMQDGAWRVMSLPPRAPTLAEGGLPTPAGVIEAVPTEAGSEPVPGAVIQPPLAPTPAPRDPETQARVDALAAMVETGAGATETGAGEAGAGAGAVEEIRAPGGFTAQIKRVDCVELEAGSGEQYAYQSLTIQTGAGAGATEAGATEAGAGAGAAVLVEDQLLLCGGLGATGIAPRGWSADARFFYYTNAAEGMPDGLCRAWYPPILRYDTATGELRALGGAVISPTGDFAAAAVDGPSGPKNAGAVWLWNLVDGSGVVLPPAAQGMRPGALAWSPDGQTLAALFHSPNDCPPFDSLLALLDADERAWRVAAQSDEPVLTGARWEDGETILLRTLMGEERRYNVLTGILSEQ